MTAPDETAIESPDDAAGDTSTQAKQPFQFSLAAGMAFVTGVSVILSLSTWQPAGGSMISSLVVGSWWSRLAWRAERRTLAYYLAAWPMGVVVGAVFGGGLPTAFSDHGSGFGVFSMIVATLASLITVRLIRKRIRTERELAGTSILAVYVTAFLIVSIYMLFAGVGMLIMESPSAGEALAYVTLIWFMAMIMTTIVATISLPLSWPISLFFCTILQMIDPPEQSPSSERPNSLEEILQEYKGEEEGEEGGRWREGRGQ